MKIASVESLIKKARILSNSTDFGEEFGLDDEPFILSLCDAQVELQSAIVEEECEAFVDYAEVAVVANQEAYDIPVDTFIHNLVYKVAWSRDGSDGQYRDLDDRMFREETCRGMPEEYVIEGNQIYINPVPNTDIGTLRLRYEKALDKLDKKRGVIESFVDLGTGFQPSSIVLEEGADTDKFEEECEYVCVNDKHGNVITRNIPIESWDTSSRTLTVESGYVSDNDNLETGLYVTIGADTTTHSKLLYACEPYLYNVAAFDAMRLRSSTDAPEESEKMKRLLNAVMGVYKRLPAGKQRIPERRSNW